jgi:uncharacterized protein involved in outer membrane biogenesis
MNNALLILGALLVGILSALVAVPMIVDWNSYRGVFEEEASRILGRDVRVGGAVAVRLLPTPYVKFEKLRIADTVSTGGDPLFRADTLTMRLSIGALLKGAVEAENVELKRPALRLAVDQEGRGNWRTLSLSQGALPFLPADVALKSVGITGGRLTLVGGAGREIVLEEIEGELAADGTGGPYRFKGVTQWAGGAREVRVSTGSVEPDGTLKVKTGVRVPANGNTYAFDGRIVDVRDKPRADGELTAKLPIAGRKAEDQGAIYELKAKVEADSRGGQLADVALSLDDLTDPQLVTGDVKASWGQAPRFDMVLASRSLNLDRFASAGASNDPLDTARAALNIVLGALPAEADTSARLKADRVILAGEPVTGVSVAMSRSGPLLELRELKAELPGSTRLEASGAVSRDTRTMAFAGPIRIRGSNMGRFMAWARGAALEARAARPVPSSTAASARYDGPFGVEGLLAMGGDAIELTSAMADFGDGPIAGAVRVSTEGRRRVSLTLDARRLDLAQVLPGGIEAERLRTALGGLATPAAAGATPSTQGAGATGFYAVSPETADYDIQVRAEELRAASGLELRNVDTALKIQRGTLTVAHLRLTAPSGLDVELEGDIDGLDRTADAGSRKGRLRWVVGAPTAAAAAEALAALAWPAGLQPSDAVLQALGPVRMAGATVIGARTGQSLDVSFDGAVDGGRVYGAVQLDQGLEAWQRQPISGSVTIETPRIERWLEITGLAAPGAASSGRAIGRGTVFLKAAGRLETGVTTYATIASEAVAGAYQGVVVLAAGKPLRLDGLIGLTARDAADALVVSGIAPGISAVGAPLSGQVQVKLDDGLLRLDTAGLEVGTSTIGGTVQIAGLAAPGAGTGAAGAAARPAEGTRTVDARLSVDTLNLPALAAALSDRRQLRASSSDGADTIWSEEPLSLAALDGISGKIDLSAGSLVVQGQIALADVKSQVLLGLGKIRVEKLQGAGLGGKLAATASLERIPGGAALAIDGTMDGIDLARLNRGVTIGATITASVQAQGISARGIVAALKGQGELAQGAGRVSGVAPAALASLADRLIAAKDEVDGEALAQQVRSALAGSALELRARKLPLVISEGVVRMQTPLLDAEGGQAKLDVSVDLAALSATSDWRIEARTKPLPSGRTKPPMPVVTVTTAGPLAAINQTATLASLQAFEQELNVRRIERETEDLERARLLAEDQRAKVEAERIAAEAAAAAAAAGATASPPASGAASAPPSDGAAAGQGAPPSLSPPSANVPAAASNPAGSVASPAAANSPATAAPATASPATSPPRGNAARRRAEEPFPKPFANP